MSPRRRRRPIPAPTRAEVEQARWLLERHGEHLTVGGPVGCTSCSGYGLVTDWDPATHRFAYACPTCDATWVLSHDVLRAARRAPGAEAEGAPAPAAAAPAEPWARAVRPPATAGVPHPEEAPVVRVRWAADPAT